MVSLKTSTFCVLAAVLCLSANTARAESYGSDAPNAGAAAAQAKAKAKAKEGKVRFVQKQYVVHPQVSTSTRKRGK